MLKNDNVEPGDELHDIFSSAMACMAKPLIPESTLSSFVQSGSQLQTALTVVQSDQLKSLVRQLSFIDTGASAAAKLTNNIFDSALFNPNIELNLRIPQYDFSSTLLNNLPAIFETSKSLSASIGKMLDATRIASSIMGQFLNSPALEWLRTFDPTPILAGLQAIQTLNLDRKILGRFNHSYLIAMYECKWFPYVGWTAGIDLVTEISDILATSRGASKRRNQRVDKAILDYYTKKEIKRIKREWNASDLEFHIKKILGQAIEAHLRGEYALTITCLATMWESLIQQKYGLSGRRVQNKIKKDFAKLIDENDYEAIISDFYNNLIVSQCNTPDEVIEGVPNRNAISHGKYRRYPNKKASLNAILLTEFIISLEPKSNVTEEENGQAENADAEQG